MWLVYWVNLVLGLHYSQYGILPRTLTGLKGVLFSPFIHGSLEHLYQNTIPIFVMMVCLRFFYKKVFWKVLFWGLILSGLGTWIIGKTAYHIGMSGMIYVLVSFIFFKGIFSKYFRLIALSLGIVFVYGGLIWYVFPIKPGMSWEGHLAGLLTGLYLAYSLKVTLPRNRKYPWEKPDFKEEEDEFLKHFDKDGNFIESQKEEEEENKGIKINYFFKSNKKEK